LRYIISLFIWWKYYVLMYENGKTRYVETVLGIGGGKVKGEWQRG
jgi:hypothetical protein